MPNRRAQLIRHVKFKLFGDTQEREFDLGLGYVAEPLPEGGRILEVFVDATAPGKRGDSASGFKVGSQIYFQLNDDAVMISLLLQLGCTPKGLRRHLGGGERGARGPEGSGGKPTSFAGVIADAVVAAQEELALIWDPALNRELRAAMFPTSEAAE